MTVKVGDVVRVLEELAPQAEPGDGGGLELGDPEWETRRVLVALEVDRQVLAEAGEGDLVVTHHPLLGRFPAVLREDEPTARVVAALVRARAALFVVHPDFADAQGGPADLLAQTLGLQEVRPFGPAVRRRYLKLVVFVPVGHEEAVREALAEAGAGWIGRYSHCTFQTAGTGTFLPREGAQPYAGRVGRLEKVEELRLETIVPEERCAAAVEAMCRAHPYEEVAYDLYPLANPCPAVTGPGRLGNLPRPLALEDFAAEAAVRLAVSEVRVVGDRRRPVTRVAVVPGAGAARWREARAAGADVLVTGDLDHRTAVAADLAGLAMVDVGHAPSEAAFVPAIAARLRARWPSLEVRQMATAKPLTGVERERR